MRICKSQTGYALALLMWMIAGMSLLVSNNPYAQDDIGLAEQRLNEAKSDALARGVAMLALDKALAPYLDEAKPDGDGSTGRNGGNRTDNKRVDGALSSRRYELDGHVAVACAAYLWVRVAQPRLWFLNWVDFTGSWVERQDQKYGCACAEMAVDYRNQRSANSTKLRDFLGV